MKLSIIVAVYNTSAYLRQCLDSIVNQTLNDNDYEIIIVNDGSTDNSIDIINEYAGKYNNISVIDKKNEATFWSRVDGIVASKGDYIGFVDSDDYMMLEMYENLYNEAEKSGADIVECGSVFIYEDGSSAYESRQDTKVISTEEAIKAYAEDKMTYPLFSRIYSKKIMDEFIEKMYPYFNNRRKDYCGIRNEDDLLLPLFISLSNKLLILKDCYCYHRESVPGSTMDRLKKGSKQAVDASIYRVNAGFDIMRFTKDKKELYRHIEGKQIEKIFSLMGRLLESDCYSKTEAKVLIKDAIKRLNEEKSQLPFGKLLRFWHLKLKACFVFK